MMSYEEDSGMKCLEPNHTHFILVKDKDKESVDEAKIRDKLVSMIASRKIKGSKGTRGSFLELLKKSYLLS